ncbi:hypothetical protein VPH35_059240 [Triticum aestivum]|uniref:Uncharacterized protein n=1 Tax=Aegilops tauschii subsp. strangulata TaxID=200361 RepID=A0A453EK89_AEGTS
MVACRRMCLRPKLLPLDRGYMHPCLEAAVLGDMHVQGEEVDKGRRSNMVIERCASAGASLTTGKEGSEVTAIALGSWKP